MEKFKIIGMVFSHIGRVEVEAENYEDAMDKAREEFFNDEGTEKVLLPVPENLTNFYTVMADDVEMEPNMEDYFKELQEANKPS